LPDLRAAAGAALVEVATEEISDDWEDRWRSFHRPLVIDDRLAVRPPWEPSTGAAIEIVIDPGRAFGTGAHATTSLCLELMLLLTPAGTFVDLGCGSGVLAIAAAKLGWAPVMALDNDPASIDAVLRNARANTVEVDVLGADIRSSALPLKGTVAANLLAPLLQSLAARITQPPDRLIASGLLVTEADRVAAAFAGSGLTERQRRTRGDWAALLLERGSG
jgi:ribosomal protein L11 methyltransferase